MADTYCGKDCQVCSRKERLYCHGCKLGPGQVYGGDCELAQCVRSKGHETCDTCGFRSDCALIRGREEMPAKRQRKREYEQYRREQNAKKAPFFGKWLWIMFWLVVPNVIAALMYSDIFQERMPGVYKAGEIMIDVLSILYCVILLVMGAQESRYRTAGICSLLGCGLSWIMHNVGTMLLLYLPALILTLVAEYQEYSAHSDALVGIDNILSYRWTLLWKWQIAIYGGSLLAVIMLFVLPIVGELLTVVAGIGTLVTTVLRMVFLYQSAYAFRKYRV